MNRPDARLVAALGAVLFCAAFARGDPPATAPAQPTTAPGHPTTTRASPAPAPGPAFDRGWWMRMPPPLVWRIEIPDFPAARAVWGATGSDSRGHVWFGVSAEGGEMPSAHLFEYVPASGKVIDRGDVVGELKRLGLHRPGEGQMKIHSKIFQADDGNLYFASMDEQGEDLRTEKLPPWGGHLWRLRLPENRWEHLLATEHPLIALAGAGSKVYALGYFGHVLYQYDWRTGRSARVTVGSVNAHVSRNLFTDRRGHVYVPRVRAGEVPGNFTATLVEYDQDLREVGEIPLKNYLSGSPMWTHGIVGFQPLEDGSIAFLTHSGRLHLLKPAPAGPAGESSRTQPASASRPANRLLDLGWFHPDGPSYAPSLFADAANHYLMGVAQVHGRYDWVVYDLAGRRSTAAGFTLRGDKPLWDQRTLLYGSTVRDHDGNFYVGGVAPCEEGTGQEPILLKIRPAWRP